MSNKPVDEHTMDKGERIAAGIPVMKAKKSKPEFRSVALSELPTEPQVAATRQRSVPPPKSFDSNEYNEVIDKEAFFGGKTTGEEEQVDEDGNLEGQNSNFLPTNLRPVPAFYPLEKSSRFIDDELSDVATRISECLRILSVQAIYDNEMATASLLTGENVEMHLSLWKTCGGNHPDGIVVELQRRKGCSITFHRYSRHILDAAIGDFDLPEFVRKNGDEVDRAYSRKLQRLLSTGKDTGNEQENAIIAIEIAHGLLMKDRMDARQLGLESLCLLTDPRKTGSVTAVIASHVVLLGTARGPLEEQDEGMMFDEAPFQEIQETILSLVQLRRIGDEAEFSEEERDDEELDPDVAGQHPEDRELLALLHNLALAVMANALDVIENYDSYDSEPEETAKMPASNRGRANSSEIANAFMNDAKDFSKREILSTLIQELDKASRKPHNACLSAKCLRCLFGASEDARKKARELGAKTVVSTALDVGERTHAKLENECKKVVKVLTENPDDS